MSEPWGATSGKIYNKVAICLPEYFSRPQALPSVEAGEEGVLAACAEVKRPEPTFWVCPHLEGREPCVGRMHEACVHACMFLFTNLLTGIFESLVSFLFIMCMLVLTGYLSSRHTVSVCQVQLKKSSREAVGMAQ